MTPNEVLTKAIVGSIRQLYRAVYLDAAKTGRRFGLTASQSGVLRTLFHNGSMSSADLSRKLFVTPSNITGIIDRLEKKGLVERVRKETDRRVSLITLTPSGADVSGMLPDPIEKKLISRLAHLDTRKVERLQEAMEEILAMVGGEDLSDSPIEIAQEPGGEDRH